jgi:hypothetical protein
MNAKNRTADVLLKLTSHSKVIKFYYLHHREKKAPYTLLSYLRYLSVCVKSSQSKRKKRARGKIYFDVTVQPSNITYFRMAQHLLLE